MSHTEPIDSRLLPEGTEWLDFCTPCFVDSPVGKTSKRSGVAVVRDMQYGVREGREASGAGDPSRIDTGRMPDPLQFAVSLMGGVKWRIV